jgi:hypothetical protein
LPITAQYENKYKNINLTKLGDLDNLLNLLADLNEPIELFAIGGTAMVLKGIKESTKDIDFLTIEKQEKIRKMYDSIKNKYETVVVPTPLKVKEYRQVQEILKRCQIRKERRGSKIQ